MGREAGAWKERVCKHCKEVFYSDSEGLKDHSDTCKRLKDLGLVPVTSRGLIQEVRVD